MRNVRVFLTANNRLVLLLVVLALFAKALIPTGYMVGNASKVLTVQLCVDGSGATKSTTIAIPMGKESPGQSDSHGKTDGTCAFSSLSMASMAAADPVLLDLALAFILLLGFAALASPRLRAITHLRPPLRGPPAAA